MHRRLMAPALALLAVVLPFAARAQDSSAPCLECHVAAEFQAVTSSVHADAGCLGCHRDLEGVTSFPHTADLHPAQCAACHEEAARQTAASPHARLEVSGNPGGAPCVACHGDHDILPVSSPDSRLSVPLIPGACGGCHAAAWEQYSRSIHGKAVRQGSLDAPVCTDCHGAHTIRAHTLEESSVSPSHIPETCARCHDNVALTQKYDLPAERFATYKDSFHGIANQFGRTIVANCASCHGWHLILPTADPESSIHPSNLAQTCGHCHPNAGENFTRGKMHVKATLENTPGVFFVRRFYYLFIGGLMLIFLAYILIEYTGFFRRRRQKHGS